MPPLGVDAGCEYSGHADDDRLLFMTYNGYVMLAVAVGAFVGYMAFGGGSEGGSAAKSVACH